MREKRKRRTKPFSSSPHTGVSVVVRISPSRQDHCGLANHGTTVLAAPRRTDPIGCSLIVPAGSRVPPPAGPGARCCRYRVPPRAIFRPGPGATVPSYWHLPPFGWHRNLRPRPSSLQTTLHSGPAANSGRSCLLSLALAVQGGGGGGGDLPPPPRRLTPLCKLFLAGLSLIPPSLSSRHASRTPIRTRGGARVERDGIWNPNALSLRLSRCHLGTTAKKETTSWNQETIGVLTSDYWTGPLVPFSPRVRICASVTVAIEILLAAPLLSLPSAQCPVPSSLRFPTWFC